MVERSRDPARRFRAFAEVEARGVSPLYEEWALGVASDPELVGRLAPLPYNKQQAQLLFAAARWVGAPLGPWSELRPWLVEHWDAVLEVVQSRMTQTNEAARCGTLLPVLATIPGPIALIEVGASAGLCLIPDRYSYRFRGEAGESTLHPADGPSALVIDCELEGLAVPETMPSIVWRAGIDLHPVDLADASELAWLEALIWPGQDERLARVRTAAAVLRRDPPRIVAGDLVERLEEVAASAPRDATLVVIHTAVFNYLEPGARTRGVETIRRTGARWMSNEGPAVLPEVTARIADPPEFGNRLVLALDGIPIALAAPHGGRVSAIAAQPV